MESPVSPQKLAIILNGPALKPPPGLTSNLVNPPNNRVITHVTFSISLVLSTLAVLIRLYTKAIVQRRLDKADGEMLRYGFIHTANNPKLVLW